MGGGRRYRRARNLALPSFAIAALGGVPTSRRIKPNPRCHSATHEMLVLVLAFTSISASTVPLSLNSRGKGPKAPFRLYDAPPKGVGQEARVEERGVGDEDNAAEGGLSVPPDGIRGFREGMLSGHREIVSREQMDPAVHSDLFIYFLKIR